MRPYRERIAAAEATPLRKRIETWAEQNITTLADAWPQMPEGVEDRPAEVWEALLAIADAVGGDWPDRARAACRYFVLDSDSDDKLSLGLRLLRDIKDVFGGQDRMFSFHLVSRLIANPEWEWSDLWGKSLDQRRVAKELKRYGVESDDIRIGDAVRKGYTVDGDNGLGQAWARYLSPTSRRNERDKGDIAGQGVAECSAQNHERGKRDTNATAERPPDQELFENVADVADVADVAAMRATLLAHLR